MLRPVPTSNSNSKLPKNVPLEGESSLMPVSGRNKTGIVGVGVTTAPGGGGGAGVGVWL